MEWKNDNSVVCPHTGGRSFYVARVCAIHLTRPSVEAYRHSTSAILDDYLFRHSPILPTTSVEAQLQCTSVIEDRAPEVLRNQFMLLNRIYICVSD